MGHRDSTFLFPSCESVSASRIFWSSSSNVGSISSHPSGGGFRLRRTLGISRDCSTRLTTSSFRFPVRRIGEEDSRVARRTVAATTRRCTTTLLQPGRFLCSSCPRQSTDTDERFLSRTAVRLGPLPIAAALLRHRKAFRFPLEQPFNVVCEYVHYIINGQTQSSGERFYPCNGSCGVSRFEYFLLLPFPLNIYLKWLSRYTNFPVIPLSPLHVVVLLPLLSFLPGSQEIVNRVAGRAKLSSRREVVPSVQPMRCNVGIA